MDKENAVPSFWKTSLSDMEGMVASLKKGTSRIFANSAGGRPIHLIAYGEKQEWPRQANYSSACGAGQLSCYADKGDDARPVILIIGAIHGGELEGVAGIMNLIHILEQGHDLRGKQWPALSELCWQVRLLLIPCMNPDGRSRFPADDVWDMDYVTMRRYFQGIWKDGTLCEYPGCKTVHPILGHVAHLGSYFNDDGINLMHDNFFRPMAGETRALLSLVDEEAVDFSMQLHGAVNSNNFLMRTDYMPEAIKARHQAFAERLRDVLKAHGLSFSLKSMTGPDPGEVPPSFKLTSAIHHVSGGLSLLYESNQAYDGEGLRHTPDEIVDSHLFLFTEMVKYMVDTGGRR